MGLFLEEERRRPRALWRLAGQFAAFVVTTTLFTSLLAFAWFSVSTPEASPGSAAARFAAGSPALFFLGSLASLLSACFSLWLAGRFLDRRPFADFGFHFGGGWWLDFLFGMALGALLMTAIFLVELGSGWVTVAGSFETVEPGTFFALAILLPTTVYVCVGIYEELLSRGYQLRNAAEGLNYPAVGPRGAVLLAWVLSSIFFGALHAANPNATAVSTLNIAMAGLMLGFGYVLTGELATPIGLHITWNFFQGSVFGFPVSGLGPVGATFLSTEQGGPTLWTGGPFGPEAGLLGPAAMILGGLLIALWVRLRSGKLAVHTPIADGPKPVGEHPTQG
ncbi:MAG: CPBP family intramembrane metalloprotease [Actinobacteria bacterium]|nr:CPBP family intramembrane metalloprotease [Actinomycetota bacterium]